MTARPVVTSGLDYDPVLACRHLSDADPMLGALIARVGPCLLRPRQTQSLFAAVARARAQEVETALRVGPGP